MPKKAQGGGGLSFKALFGITLPLLLPSPTPFLVPSPPTTSLRKPVATDQESTRRAEGNQDQAPSENTHADLDRGRGEVASLSSAMFGVPPLCRGKSQVRHPIPQSQNSLV